MIPSISKNAFLESHNRRKVRLNMKNNRMLFTLSITSSVRKVLALGKADELDLGR